MNMIFERKLPIPQEVKEQYPLSDDLAAIGGLDAIRDSGLRIGEDISIAGYDGHYLSQLMRPVLTTVKQNTAMMGQRAAEMLIRSAEEPLTAGVQNITVMGELIKGETLRQVNPNRV